MGKLRSYFIAGLLVWMPIWVTLLVIRFVFHLLDGVYASLPARFQVDAWVGWHVPGVGVVITVAVILLTGALVGNFLGRRVEALGDRLISHIPLVRSVYISVKQVMQTVFSPRGQAFRKVLLVEYPRQGSWSLAFQTGQGCDEVTARKGGGWVTYFIPTTPNPTSGFLMMAPKEDVIELDMSVDQGLKFVISLGVVQPVYFSSPEAAKQHLKG